ARHASVRVELGTELADFTSSENEFRLLLREGEKEKHATASYLIGCDGASSTVRQRLGIAHEDVEFDQPWLVVDLVVNARGLEKLPKVSAQYCDPARPATYLSGPGAHRCCEIMLLPGEDGAAMQADAQVW